MRYKPLLLAAIIAVLSTEPALPGDIPPCALSGSVSVMIGGKPALRLSDVARCPADLVEVIPGIQINGEPMVHVKTGTSGKTTCLSKGDATVTVDGKQAQTLGDVACQNAE